MKNLSLVLCISLFFSITHSLFAQNSTIISHNDVLHNFIEQDLNNVDTIPDYASKQNKLKLTGTIYESDGVTPAKDVVFYIEQADENGNFEVRMDNDKEYLHHRSWIKTGADGTYTIYTFIPGNDRRYNQYQQLFPVVKAPSQDEYVMSSFLFDEDPLLTKHCRKKLAKKDDPTRILKPKMVDGVHVVQKDIVLSANANSSK